MGDGQREEDRSSLSFNAWIAIAVGLQILIVLGLHVPTYLTYRHEQKIVAEVSRLGGDVETERYAPPWPMSVLADRWETYGRLFDRAFRVLLGSAATDADVARLAGLTKFEFLQLDRTRVTDAGLVHLAGLTKLWGLGLSDTQVTDAGLVHLAGLSDIQFLYLGGTQITDAGLVHLTGLTEILSLDLDRTQITDAGLVHLAGLTELYELRLTNTQVTDAGVAELKRKLPSLIVHR